MKKIFVSIAMCTAVLLGVNACQKETAETVVPGSGYDGEGWKIDFSATIEPQGQTELKTHLGGVDKNQVYWDNTDQIVLLGVKGEGDERHHDVLKVESVIPDKPTHATFRSPELPKVEVEELACAVYPSGCVDYGNTVLTKTAGGSTGSLEGVISGAVVINFPATQTYVENSFANGANVAVGKEVKTFDEAEKSGSSSISFRNAFGVLELHLKGDFKVGKIKVTGHKGEKLNGKFRVDLDNIDDPAAFKGAVATADRTAGDDVITLDCTANGGVQLTDTTTTTSDIVVPVDAFASGFAARIYDATGTEHKFALLTTIKANDIHRSKIKAMPVMTFGVDTPKYIEVEWLESRHDSNGKAPYIKTQVKAKLNTTAAELVVNDVNGNSAKQGPEYIFGASTKTTSPIRYFLAVGKITSDKYGYVWHFGSNGTAITSNIECPTASYQGFHTHKLVGNTYYIDNNEIGTSGHQGELTSDELYLFAVPGSGGAATGDFQIKSAKIWKDGMSGPMTRNYLPCYCPSGAKYKKADGTGGTAEKDTPGMLDLVHDGLYGNQNTSATEGFIKGNSIY